MGGTHGYRRGTRHMFSKKFRKKGMFTSFLDWFYRDINWKLLTYIYIYIGPIHLSTYLRVYKVGDRVDIKVT